MPIAENRSAIVLTRSAQDRSSDRLMAPVASSSITEFLRQEVERAEIVAEETVSSLVTIETRVQFIDHNSHKIQEGRLTLPNGVRTDPSILILSSLGGASLGLGPGRSIDWINDAGRDHRLTVAAILPRRAGA